MKATELRLGNWVEYQNNYYQMFGIHNDIPFLDTIEFGDGVVEWKNIKPIPLTEEWLERFGFNKTLGGRHYTYPNPVLMLYKNKDRWDVGFWQGKGFKYVHQLQNLYFALTGEELTKNK